MTSQGELKSVFSKSRFENVEGTKKKKNYTVKSGYKVEDGRRWSEARAVSLRPKHLGNELGSSDEPDENPVPDSTAVRWQLKWSVVLAPWSVKLNSLSVCC